LQDGAPLGFGELRPWEAEAVLLAARLLDHGDALAHQALNRKRVLLDALALDEAVEHLACCAAARVQCQRAAAEAHDGPCHVDAAAPGVEVGGLAAQLVLRHDAVYAAADVE